MPQVRSFHAACAAGADHERFNFVGSPLIPAGQKNPCWGGAKSGRQETGALTAQQATAAFHSGGGMIDSEEPSSTGDGDANNTIAP
jgi:hypothetical protein